MDYYANHTSGGSWGLWGPVTISKQCPSCGRCKECGQPWPVFQHPVQPIYIPIPAVAPNIGGPQPEYPRL